MLTRHQLRDLVGEGNNAVRNRSWLAMVETPAAVAFAEAAAVVQRDRECVVVGMLIKELFDILGREPDNGRLGSAGLGPVLTVEISERALTFHLREVFRMCGSVFGW